MAGDKETIGKITFLGARLSFASLFEMNRQKQEDGTIRETWKANLLFDKKKLSTMMAVYKGKRMPALDAIRAAKAEVMEKKWGPKEKQPKLKADRIFWRDGDEENWDGYPGCWYISASAQPTDRPKVVTNRKDGNGHWIEAEPGGKAAPYSGCYVNATVIVWAQDNDHGKRVNAQIKAVQFFKDGEAFGAAAVNPDDEFTDDMAGEVGGDFADDEDDDDGMV